MILHCIGDSHASFFSGYDSIQPVFPKKSSNKYSFLKSYRLGAVLAYSLKNENTTENGREKLYRIVNNLQEGANILFCFGEIDCRCHLIKQGEIQKKNINIIAKECVDSYTSVIKDIKNKNYNVIIWNVIPTSYVNSNPEYPHYGSHRERNKCTKIFNKYLKQFALENKIAYIDISKKLLIFNYTKPYFLFDEVHLGQLAMPYFLKKIKQLYPEQKFKKVYKIHQLEILKKVVTYFFYTLKQMIKKTLISIILNFKRVFQKTYEKIIIPPYHVKRQILNSFTLKYKTNIFIETGTFLGETVEAFKNNFEKIYSIELSEELALKAKKRFEKDKHVNILHGNSGVVLNEILMNITEPCLFWLDGHYSSEFFIGTEYIQTAKGDKETPILKELEAILNHHIKNHVILIDDARCFNGKRDYPKVTEIKKLFKTHHWNGKINVKKDIIRITPEFFKNAL